MALDDEDTSVVRHLHHPREVSVDAFMQVHDELPILPYLRTIEEIAQSLRGLERLDVDVPDIDAEMMACFWRHLEKGPEE